MKFKHAIYTLIAGFMLSLIGVFLKLESLKPASEILIVSYLVLFIGFGLLLFKLFTLPRTKAFLNK
jgi:hypothetical membrane protein